MRVAFSHRCCTRSVFSSIGVLAFAVYLHPVHVQAIDMTLAWNPPTLNTVGEPLEDLAGYKVYHATRSRRYAYVFDVGDETTTTLSGLNDYSDHFFVVTAYDEEGHESPLSGELMWNSVCLLQPTEYDFDGDSISDIVGFFRHMGPNEGEWQIRRSRDGIIDTISWGWSATVPVPGDYDGDRTTDLAVYFPDEGLWYILQSSDGRLKDGGPISWGWNSSVPVQGDYDGDHITDAAVYTPEDGLWYVLQSSDGGIMGGGPIALGGNQALPVPGDYDGDCVTDIAVFSMSDSEWRIRRSSDGRVERVKWGWHGTVPAPGDFDGDHATDLSVYMPNGGLWYVLRSSDGRLMEDAPISWGWHEAAPVPGDFDGDGMTDTTVYGVRERTWYALQSVNGRSLIVEHGQRGSIPVTPLYQVFRWYGFIP
jgi:hypothetical protein